jgi:hypothetical protein
MVCRVEELVSCLVGGEDGPVIGLNRQTMLGIAAPAKELRVVPGATHLFEEPGAIDEVARLAASWFERHLETS